MVFSRRFVATVWVDDVNYDVMRSGFAAYNNKHPSSDTSSNPLATIRAKCAKDWPDDFVMRNFCEEQQKKALAKLGGGGGQ